MAVAKTLSGPPIKIPFVVKVHSEQGEAFHIAVECANTGAALISFLAYQTREGHILTNGPLRYTGLNEGVYTELLRIQASRLIQKSAYKKSIPEAIGDGLMDIYEPEKTRFKFLFTLSAEHEDYTGKFRRKIEATSEEEAWVRFYSAYRASPHFERNRYQPPDSRWIESMKLLGCADE